MTVRYKMVARYRVRYIYGLGGYRTYLIALFFFVVAGVLPPWLTAVELFHLRRFPKHIMVYKLISYFVASYIGTLSWCVQGIKSIGSYKIGLVMYDRGRQ